MNRFPGTAEARNEGAREQFARNFALRPRRPYMRGQMSDTALMPIPGLVDPVPVARDITPRADGRADLIGLPRQRIAELFAEAGLDAKQAKLRAKQVFHWLYHRGSPSSRR